jgi:ATP-dependent Lhr-like helicase
MIRIAAPPAVAADPLAPAEAWFAARGWEPFAFQREVWRAFLAGESGLIHAATGTGKTYAAWLGAVLEWMAAEGHAPPPPLRGERAGKGTGPGAKAPPLRVLWITPLRALAADTEEALRAPLHACPPFHRGSASRCASRSPCRPASRRPPGQRSCALPPPGC